MALRYDDGFYNSTYHDTETLEIDRGLQNKPSFRQNSSFHQNPYEDDSGYPGEPPNWRSGQGRPMMTDYDLQIPRYPASRDESYSLGHFNPGFQPNVNHRSSFVDSSQDADSAIDESDGILRQSRGQVMLPAEIPKYITGLDPLLEKQVEHSNRQEREKFIEKLSELSHDDITKEVRRVPYCLNDKRDLRDKVMLMKQKSSSKGVSHMNCCAGCLRSFNLPWRRFKQGAADILEAMQLWQATLKVIGGKFGTSILSYFIFLKWLLMFNIFSFVVNFSFITIPQFVDMGPNNISFNGLELLTGAGYFENTVLYYGFYTNGTIQKEVSLAPYNMQLAYIFTIGLYLATCFLILLFSIAKSFRDNFINPSSFSGNAAKLLCSWDFSIHNEKAVRLKKSHLSTQIKETLSDKLMRKLELTFGQKLARFGVHVAAWIVSTGLTVGCCAGVYFLCLNVEDSAENTSVNYLTRQAATLLVPVVVALINLIMPLVYALFGLVEKFKYPRHEIFVVIIRNIILKISIIGILCYYWLEKIAQSDLQCWESRIGQYIYRLVVIDFLFVLMGSFFGEFIRRIIGIYFCKKLGKPEFDIARNVLDLIYAQTLAWIGIFFSPLLPLIQMIKIFIIFYVKKVSLMRNCIPPQRAWRASQMTTVFLFLLFFPSFAGVLCVIGVTLWRRKPSMDCGPFRTLPTPYDSINEWISYINVFDNAKWIVWIYNNLVESVLFFYILTLIILVLSYLYWQILQGHKIVAKRLMEQIANAGKDKSYLIQELRKSKRSTGRNYGGPSQTAQRQVDPSHETQDVEFADEFRPPSVGASDAMALAMMARQQADQEENHPGRSDTLAMITRARQQAELEDQQLHYRAEPIDAMEMVIRARRQAEDEEQQQREDTEGQESTADTSDANSGAWQMDHFNRQQPRSQATTNALAMAMRARQQAEME